MCLHETISSVTCGHKIRIFTPCPDAVYTSVRDGFKATACADVETLPAVFTSEFCDDTCPYQRYHRRWVCCKCDLPNQKTFRCARQGCGHLICDCGCKPLVTRRRSREVGRSPSPGRRVDRSRSVSPEGGGDRGAPLPDLATKPRIPVYDPSVNEWR